MPLLVYLGSASCIFLMPGHANDIDATVPARAYPKVQDFRQCLTHDRTLWATRLELPKSELNKYLDRKDKTQSPSDKYLKYLENKVQKNDLNTIKFPFRKSYACPGLGKGHALEGKKVCQIWTGFKTAGVKQFDNGGTYCEFQPGGGGIAAQPVIVCQRYGKSKLGFNMEETSTFARWNGATYDAVCFYIDRLDVEAALKRVSARIEENYVNPFSNKRKKTVETDDGNNDELMEKIFKDNETDYTVEIYLATPLVGKRVAELAKIDPKLAAKFATWMSRGIHHETKMFGATKGEFGDAVGHGFNARLFRSALIGISAERKKQRARVEHLYKNYSRQKNPVVKQVDRETYEQRTRRLNAINNLELAVDELALITKEKEILEELANRKRAGKRRKGFEIAVGIAAHKTLVTIKTEALKAELKETQLRKANAQRRLKGYRKGQWLSE